MDSSLAGGEKTKPGLAGERKFELSSLFASGGDASSLAGERFILGSFFASGGDASSLAGESRSELASLLASGGKPKPASLLAGRGR